MQRLVLERWVEKWQEGMRTELFRKLKLFPLAFLIHFISQCLLLLSLWHQAFQTDQTRKTGLFHADLSDVVHLWAQGLQLWFGSQVQKVGVSAGNTSTESPKMTLHISPLCLCSQAWAREQRFAWGVLENEPYGIVPVTHRKCVAGLQCNARRGSTRKSCHKAISLPQLTYG